jgi:hypothetical protein
VAGSSVNRPGASPRVMGCASALPDNSGISKMMTLLAGPGLFGVVSSPGPLERPCPSSSGQRRRRGHRHRLARSVGKIRHLPARTVGGSFTQSCAKGRLARSAGEVGWYSGEQHATSGAAPDEPMK